MDQFTKDFGKMIQPGETEDLSMLMVMCISESGKMIMLMVREYIYIVMVHNTKENGLKIDNMG
jgi:hypothetical protein